MASETADLARVRDQLDRARGEKSTLEAVAENAIGMARRIQEGLPSTVTPAVASGISGAAGYAIGVANESLGMTSGWGEAAIPAVAAVTGMVSGMWTESPDWMAAEGAFFDIGLGLTSYVAGKQTVKAAKGFWDRPAST